MVEGTGLPFLIVFVAFPALIVCIIGFIAGYIVGRKSK